MMRCARCDISQVPSGPSDAPGTARCGRASASSIPGWFPLPGTEARSDDRRLTPARDHAPVSTRTLLILAAITGVAILAAGAVQILLAR